MTFVATQAARRAPHQRENGEEPHATYDPRSHAQAEAARTLMARGVTALSGAAMRMKWICHFVPVRSAAVLGDSDAFSGWGAFHHDHQRRREPDRLDGCAGGRPNSPKMPEVGRGSSTIPGGCNTAAVAIGIYRANINARLRHRALNFPQTAREALEHVKDGAALKDRQPADWDADGIAGEPWRLTRRSGDEPARPAAHDSRRPPGRCRIRGDTPH
ncbi:MAG: hypothetical protein ISP90_03455 [Nevskia sp.]|nr:hypothetical protein [Nevskia sp.]